nr:uncharacterized protein LOC121824252 [Peromyscus maniculatus bairdii]
MSAWSNAALGSLRYLFLGSPRPQTQGSRLLPREGSPGHRSRRHPPSFPPSLRRPPSLPRTLPLAGPSRGQPALDQIQFSCPGHSPETAEVCGAYSLAHTDHRARRTARSLRTLGCRPPTAQTPNRPQGPSYRLNIRLPSSPLTTAQESALLSLQPKSTHSPPCPCSRTLPGHPSESSHLLGYTWANLVPSKGPTQSSFASLPVYTPPVPACRLHVTCSQEGLHLPACEPRQGRLPG